jgi:Holliday junction resolvasome RuvABC DNA-binding subunit
MKIIGSKMIELAKETEFFEILVSVPGISDISATRLIGECRDKENKQTGQQAAVEAHLYNDDPDGNVYA